MQKLFIGGGVLLLAVAAWFIIFQPSSTDYVADVNDEVEALEVELAELETTVTNNQLTPQAAVAAQASIASRLDSINTSIERSNNADLTANQRAALVSGLDRLKRALERYQSTLAAIDTSADEVPAEDRPRSSRRSGGGLITSIVEEITQTINSVEEHVEEVVDDYVPNEQTNEIASSTDNMFDENSDTLDHTDSTDGMTGDASDPTDDSGNTSDESTDDAMADTETATDDASTSSESTDSETDTNPDLETSVGAGDEALAEDQTTQ